GHTGREGRALLRQIGDVLLMQHKMVGRVEVAEKPDLLWDHPELERLYARLQDEFELNDRARALDRKLDLISRTAATSLDLLQNRRTLRVEWYIVILIVIELVLLVLYETFMAPRG
ncbi:MAG: RMD1 family protein, partial [Rhodospirillales bacterium]